MSFLEHFGRLFGDRLGLNYSQPFLFDEIETPDQDKKEPALTSPSHTPEPTMSGQDTGKLKELTWSPQSVIEQFSFKAGEEGFTCFTYSQLSQADAEKIKNITERLLASSDGQLEFINLPTVTPLPQSLIGLVYQDGVEDDLVGFWLANPSAIDPSQCEFLVIVDKNFRQKGIATNLVKYACDFLINRGVSTMVIDLGAKNTAVQKLIAIMEQTHRARHKLVSYGDEMRYAIHLPTRLTPANP